MLKEWPENVGGLGDIDNWDLSGGLGGLGYAEHVLENRGSETEDEAVDAELFLIRGT